MTVSRVALGLVFLLLAPICFWVYKEFQTTLTDTTIGGFNTAAWPVVYSGLFFFIPAFGFILAIFYAFTKLFQTGVIGPSIHRGRGFKKPISAKTLPTIIRIKPGGAKRKPPDESGE